jgi:hypothetical protein
MFDYERYSQINPLIRKKHGHCNNAQLTMMILIIEQEIGLKFNVSQLSEVSETINTELKQLSNIPLNEVINTSLMIYLKHITK